MQSEYQQQLERGFRTLVFNPGLEKEFRADIETAGLAQLRVALIIGSLFGLAFPIMDYFFDGPGFSDRSIPMRTAVTQPLLIVMYAITYMPRFRHLLTFVGVGVGFSIGLTTLFLDTVGQTYGIAADLSSYVLATFYIYFFLGLRFWPALNTAILLFAVFILVGILGPSPVKGLVYSGVFLVFANAIAATGLYNLEYNRRLSFLEEGELRFRANQDALTKIANRGAFDAHFERMWRHCSREQIPLAIALVDVDHFKQYNDHYGHQAGDDCLVEVAPMIEAAAKRPLDLGARYGGEEFVLLLPGCDVSQAAKIVEELRSDVVTRMIEHEASPTARMLTVSAGVASVRPPASDMQQLLQDADEALYRAKEDGRNRVRAAPDATPMAEVVELDGKRQNSGA